jgi:hypothetical protein
VTILDKFCAGEIPEVKTYNAISRELYYIDTYTRKYMCSGICECDEDYFDDYTWEFYGGHDISEKTYDGEYTRFKDCYEDNDENGLFRALDDEVLNFVADIEKDSRCSGFCSGAPSPFYFTYSGSSGPPI